MAETPSEGNKNKYILTHESGKPIYELTKEQLADVFQSGKAGIEQLRTRVVAEKENCSGNAEFSETIEEWTAALLNIVGAGTIISYQGGNYKVAETPSEGNKNKYILTHESGKPIYELTKEQLADVFQSGKAGIEQLRTRVVAEKEKCSGRCEIRKQSKNGLMRMKKD